MPRTIAHIAILAAALLALVMAPSAGAASPGQIIKDCTSSDTGYLKGTYTVGDLRRALREVRGDVAEYTGCYDAIRAALGSARGARNGGGSGGGGDTPTSDGGASTFDGGGGAVGGTAGSGSRIDPEQELVVAGGAPAVQTPATPQRGSAAPVRLDGATVRPGAIPSIGREANALPSPMVVLLALLGAGAVGALATTIGRRVLARRGA